MLAGDACSRDAMLALAAGYGLTGLRPGRLADDIAAAAASSGAGRARAAAETLAAYGRRLGALVVTLRDPGTAGAQAAGNPVRRACLSYWLAVDSIWLGGGLLAGDCGPAILAGVQESAAAAARPCPVALTPYPAIAPLLGAALHGPAAGGPAAGGPAGAGEVIVVADIGHTSIKTAAAHRDAEAVTGIWLLVTCPAPSGRTADEVADSVAAALIPAIRRAADPHARGVRVIASIASYLSGGVPADDGRGIYGCLAGAAAALRHRLSAASGTAVTLEFVHDGTAAAATAGSANSATITAGTALGCGFRPAQAQPSRRLFPGLRAGAWRPARAGPASR